MSFFTKHIAGAIMGACRSKWQYSKSFNVSTGNTYYSTKLDEDVKKYMKLAFIQADKDKDGTVSGEEIKTVLKTFFVAKGKPESPILNIFFDKMVFQEKPYLTQEELLSRINYSVNFLHSFAEDILTAKFSYYDTDKDGKITRDDLKNILEGLYPFANKDMMKLMNRYDDDNDGKISLEEFLKFAEGELFIVKL